MLNDQWKPVRQAKLMMMIGPFLYNNWMIQEDERIIDDFDSEKQRWTEFILESFDTLRCSFNGPGSAGTIRVGKAGVPCSRSHGDFQHAWEFGMTRTQLGQPRWLPIFSIPLDSELSRSVSKLLGSVRISMWSFVPTSFEIWGYLPRAP